MDIDRRREVYLRVAREAAIAGRKELATMAADQAKLLSGSEEGADALAKLYGSLVGVPTENVDDAMAVLMNIPEDALSPRDRALRQAAETVAKEVLRKPEPVAAPQTPSPVEAPQAGEAVEAAATDQELQDPFAQPQAADAAPGEAEVQPAAAEPGTPPAEQAEIDPELRTFVDAGRSKLDAIDDLLQKEGP
jgi:chemotaxis protein MotC